MKGKDKTLIILFINIIMNGSVLYLNNLYRDNMTYYTEIPLIIFMIFVNYAMIMLASKQMIIYNAEKLLKLEQIENIETTSELSNIINGIET